VALPVGGAALTPERLLVDVRVGGGVLEQVVAERRDVAPDEVEHALVPRGSLLEEVDDVAEQRAVRQADRPDLEEVPLDLLVDDPVVAREGLDPRRRS
jgi:hypothetical protein